MQTSGKSCRENANVYLPFQIRIDRFVVPDKRATRAPIRDSYAAAVVVWGAGGRLSLNHSGRWLMGSRLGGRDDVVREECPAS